MWGRRTVALDHDWAVSAFLHQIERGVKVVHVQPHRPLQVGHGLPRHLARVAFVAPGPADYLALPPLNSGPNVPAVHPGPGELDAMSGKVSGPSSPLLSPRTPPVAPPTADIMSRLTALGMSLLARMCLARGPLMAPGTG